MKYKRQLMTGIFTLSLLAGSSVFAAGDFIPPSKIDQYQSQVQMKSYDKSFDDDNEQVPLKRHKRSPRPYKKGHTYN